MREETDHPSVMEQLAELTARVVDEHADDMPAAANALKTALKAQPDLMVDLAEHLLFKACYEAVTHAVCTRRARAWASAPTASAASNSRVRALAASNLMAFPLPGGLPLARATRDDVLAAVAFYRTQADDMAAKARWLAAIAERVPSRKCVADVLDETALADLKAEVSV